MALILFGAALFLPIRFVAEANPDWRLLSWDSPSSSSRSRLRSSISAAAALGCGILPSGLIFSGGRAVAGPD